jgi:hypothetical protein
MSIISPPIAEDHPAPDVRPLAHALTHMHPDLWAPLLEDESFEDALVRREAARDILDDLLAEFAELAAEVPA